MQAATSKQRRIASADPPSDSASNGWLFYISQSFPGSFTPGVPNLFLLVAPLILTLTSVPPHVHLKFR